MEEVGAEHNRKPPPLEVVELRIHGVHGTSPAGMLGLANEKVEQVAGDSLTGIYRPKPGVRLPLRDLAGQQISVEAYSWGALTSGVRGALGWVKRALWLGLLPFALVNLSYWARVRLAEDSALARWGARATRIGALLLTVFFVLTPSLLGIDLVAWQCYRWGSPTCSLPGFFDFMGTLSPGQRIALGSVVPLAAIGILGFLSRTTLQRYEASHPGHPHQHEDGPDYVLRHARLWRTTKRTRELQRIHLTVALATVVGFSGGHVLAAAEGTAYWLWATVTFTAVVAALAFCWILVIHPDDVDRVAEESRIVQMRGRLPRGLKDFLRDRLPNWLLIVMLALTAAHLLSLYRMGNSLNQDRDFAGHNMWFIAVFVALTAVHLSVFTSGRMTNAGSIIAVAAVLGFAAVALVLHAAHSFAYRNTLIWTTVVLLAVFWAVLLFWHYRQGTEHRAEAWNGAGASVMLAAAGWVALLFTTGIVMAGAYYLSSSGHGVGDLISKTSPRAVAATSAVTDVPQYSATGAVVIDHAVVRLTGSGVEVIAGVVRVDTLAHQTGAVRPPAVVPVVGNVDLGRGRILLPTLLVQLADTCVQNVSDDSVCSAESPDFVSAGTVHLRSPFLTIGGGGTVTVSVAKPPHVPLVVPQVLIWSPLVQVVWLLGLALVLVVSFLVFRRSWPALDQQLLADSEIPVRDHEMAIESRRTAALAHRAERLIDRIGALTAVLAIVLIALSSTGQAPWDMVSLGWTRRIATLAMWVAVGLGLGLVYLASLMRTSENARRGLGILWDLTTFWPRAAHPLAPPCYAERVVPELRTRIDWALYEKPGVLRPNSMVVLSAHSQGSTIITAVLSRLSQEELARVRVITYGSQVRGLYGRIFPRVFGHEAIGYQPTTGPTVLSIAFPDAVVGHETAPPFVERAEGDWVDRPLMDRLLSAGGQWQNLFRRTDPLGYRVFSDTDEKPDNWVPEVPAEELGDPGPQVLSHGNYQHSLRYREIVAEWTGETVVANAEDTTRVPPLPPS